MKCYLWGLKELYYLHFLLIFFKRPAKVWAKFKCPAVSKGGFSLLFCGFGVVFTVILRVTMVGLNVRLEYYGNATRRHGV
jgi:hypothetical protein